MKTLKTILLFSIAAFFFTACKKDGPKPETTQDKISGKWNIISWTIETTRPPNPTETETRTTIDGDYFDFRPEGEIYVLLKGIPFEEVYTINSETEITLGNDPFTIKELTSTKLILEQLKQNSTRTEKTTIVLDR